jgi:hypothetical protein
MNTYIALYEDDNQTKRDSGDFANNSEAYQFFMEKYGNALVKVFAFDASSSGCNCE